MDSDWCSLTIMLLYGRIYSLSLIYNIMINQQYETNIEDTKVRIYWFVHSPLYFISIANKAEIVSLEYITLTSIPVVSQQDTVCCKKQKQYGIVP